MATLTAPSYARGPIIDPAEPYNGIYETSATQEYHLGTKLELNDGTGRVFRYAQAGATALVQARMNQSAITNATYFHQQVQTGYGMTAGALDVTALVTTGGSAASGGVENDLADGFMVCNKTSPAVLGDIYIILASKLRSTDTILDLKLSTPIRNTIAVTGELTFVMNRFKKSLVFAAYEATAQANGVALCPVTAGYYYWSQTKGPAPLLVDGNETYDIGQMIGCPSTLGTAGDGGPAILTDAQVLRTPWGRCMEIATPDEPGLVDLCLE